MEKLFLIPISNRLVETNMFVVFFFLFAGPVQLYVTLALAAAVVRAFFTDGCHLAGQQSNLSNKPKTPIIRRGIPEEI